MEMESRQREAKPMDGFKVEDSKLFAQLSASIAEQPEMTLPQVPHKIRGQAIDKDSVRSKTETRMVMNLIESYFEVVKINVQDMVPKAIMAFLVNESRKRAQSELVDLIYKEGNFDELIVEDPMIVASRQNCREIIEALKKSQSLLAEVAHFRV
jgi:dynamin 1-like protein